jgi:hypothetical protein
MEISKIRRDANSQAIHNTDTAGLLAYKAKQLNALRMKELETSINIVKDEIAEIKIMLQQIITTRG